MPTIGFKGGERLEARLNDLGARLGNAKEVRVGFLENALYPDGTYVATVAAIQEWGAPSRHIPPRPFFRTMIAAQKDGWPAALDKNLQAHDYDARTALSLMGEGIAGQLRQSIVDTNDPPNAPSTIARKGHDKPLVDSGYMLQRVDYEIE
jgi:hypothetical protein